MPQKPNVPKPVPRGAALPTERQMPRFGSRPANNPQPSPRSAPRPHVAPANQPPTHTPHVAGIGSSTGIGLGMGLGAAKAGLGQLTPLARDPNCPDIPGISSPTAGNAFACSQGTLDFLKANVPREEDLAFVRREGYVNFERTLGRHIIPLQDVDQTLPSAKRGSLLVPVGMTFLVTHFFPMAFVPNVGLPGAYESVDPGALIGQVCFNLLESNRAPVFSLSTLTNGELCPGGTLLFQSIEKGGLQTVGTADTSITAGYDVAALPFPGFPFRVGVKVSGFMIPTILLDEALGNCYQAGG